MGPTSELRPPELNAADSPRRSASKKLPMIVLRITPQMVPGPSKRSANIAASSSPALRICDAAAMAAQNRGHTTRKVRSAPNRATARPAKTMSGAAPIVATAQQTATVAEPISSSARMEGRRNAQPKEWPLKVPTHASVAAERTSQRAVRGEAWDTMDIVACGSSTLSQIVRRPGWRPRRAGRVPATKKKTSRL